MSDRKFFDNEGQVITGFVYESNGYSYLKIFTDQAIVDQVLIPATSVEISLSREKRREFICFLLEMDKLDVKGAANANRIS